MSREVRRVPMDWQHPMEWRERWDCTDGRVKMRLVPKALLDDFAGALAEWETSGRNLRNRTGWDWDFAVQYHLTGFQGRDDDAPATHPKFELGDTECERPICVRDEDHLLELELAEHAASKPDPANFMPDFSGIDPDLLGYCMYETTSEGTPISPVMASPESLARWLADNEASAFGGMSASYEQWLSTCRTGWAPSAVASSSGLESGVSFVARAER